MAFFSKIVSILKDREYLYYRLKAALLYPIYQSYILPGKVKKLRKKDIIKVLYVLNEVGSWKTETLYNKMCEHPRFKVSILVVPTEIAPYNYEMMKLYLDKKGYKYDIIQDTERIDKLFNPDIIFYQKPYHGIIDKRFFYRYNLKSLFCYVLYCFRNRDYPGIRSFDFINFIWQFYAENDKVIEESVPVFCTKARNMVNTGLPFMDDLLLDKSHYNDPWKDCGDKKRIIYAPHHTIFSDLYEYATFLDYCDYILDLAEKYKDKVQWAFKPHPLLKEKLFKVWGEKKTLDYYSRWESMDNCQIAEGEYMGLFKHSSAMIHDSGSFKLEYLYTNNPVMFLMKGTPVYDYSNWQTEESLNMHYKGYNKDDIERFVINVINGEDQMKEQRKAFVENYLTPPNGKSACDNIINAILGEAEYSAIA